MDDFITQTTREFLEGLTGEDAWDNALCNFADRLGFTTSGFHVLGEDGSLLKSIYSSRLPEDTEQKDYDTISFNPRYKLIDYSNDKSARVFSDRDIIDPRGASEDLWYQEVGKPLACYAWLGGYIPLPSDQKAIFNAMRGSDWIEPTQNERMIMHRTLNALAGVFDTFTRIEKFNTKSALGLLGSNTSIGAIRRDGKVLEYNSLFQSETQSGVGISLLNGFLTFQNSNDQSELHRLIQSPLIAKKSFITNKLSDGSHRRIILLPSPWSRVGPSSVAGLLTIESPKHNVKLDQELLKLNYQLTDSETRVAVLLMDGKSTEELAEQRGVLVSTIRTQINALMDKMQCKSRVQLMSVLARYIVNL